MHSKFSYKKYEGKIIKAILKVWQGSHCQPCDWGCPNIPSLKLVWPLPLAQVWTHYEIGKLNMWTLFCNVCIDFFNRRIWKEIMLEWNGKPSSVLNWFFLPKPDSLEFILILSGRNHVQINISHIPNPNPTK
jgi:hypothetical protein